MISKNTVIEDYEVECDVPDNGRRTLLLNARKLFHADNSNMTLLLAIEDITLRRQAERKQELLLGELRHRMKNLLAMVQALARQTRTEGCSAEEYQETFLGRLGTLVHAQELGLERKAGTALSELIALLLEPYIGLHEGQAVVVEAGPAVALTPAKVQALSLILHELATNAVKHGALSVPEGRLRLKWRIEEANGSRRLRLHWQEGGGPKVEPPTSCGFGSRLIALVAQQELEGGAELIFEPEGLQAEITVQLS